MGHGAGHCGCARASPSQAVVVAGARCLVLCGVRRQLFRAHGLLAGSGFSRRSERPHDSRRRKGQRRLGPMMKTLFLHPPSFDGFDGGAGSRYQAKREIRSFWYPTWLAQPAALVADSRLLDAPADGVSVEQTLAIAQDYDLVVIHTSTPSFPTDALFAQDLKQRKPSLLVGMVGAKVAVDPHDS